MKKCFKNLYTNMRYKKQYINLLISYIVVMVVVLVINLIGHLVISEVTRRETYQSNSRLVKQIQVMCDASIDDALLAVGRMINTNSMTVLSDMTEYSDSQYNSHVKNVIKELEIVVNSNKMITQGYVAFKDSDICISSNAMFNKQILYETAFSDYFESEAEMLDAVFGAGIKEFKVLKGVRDNKFMLFYSFSNRNGMLPTKKRPVVIMLELDVSKIIQVQSANVLGDFLVVFNSGETLLANDDIDYFELVSSGAKDFCKDGKNYLLTKEESQSFGGTYVHYIEKSVYSNMINIINRIIISTFIFCLLVGAYFVFLMTHRNYISVVKVLDKIETDTKCALEKRMEKREAELQNMHLENIISGRLKADGNAIVKYFPEFKHDYYCIALFNILDFAIGDDDGHISTFFSISNVFSELTADFSVNRYIYMDGFYVCLLNFEKNSEYNVFLDEKLQQTNRFINMYLGISFKYVLSEASPEPEAIAKLYSDSAEALSRGMFGDDEDEGKTDMDERCLKIMEYIEENYSDGNLSVKSIADDFGLSFNYISKYFKEHTGEGLAKYIIYKRIEKAKDMLLNTNYSIKRIADQTGFYSDNVFIRTFKKVENITPGQYREQNKAN